MTNHPIEPHPVAERIARAIATAFGDDLDHAFANKSEWNAARGEKGGRYRDINEPMRPDYFDAMRAALLSLREPTPDMVEAGAMVPFDTWNGKGKTFADDPTPIFTAMINTIIGDSEA